ncbi:DEKNAAC101806 [Brettanomyces naardenensis]|uniref:DEKNAAC101806 n=1 Tax=Brettanomyces naardenensis TaxID=13370 RepID=A0A448YJD1_BRENA|nr:DEKNAAC101806 [Brettanomyces naardenensis]
MTDNIVSPQAETPDPEPYMPSPGGRQEGNSNDGASQTDSELVPLLAHLIRNEDLIIENKTSEPRDLLMSERTFLSWVKTGTMLCLVSGMMSLNFRLDTSNEGDGNRGGHWATEYSFGISILLCLLGLGCFAVATIAYFQALYSYKNQKIKIYDTNLLAGYLAVLCVTLFGVSIIFMVKG